jgi:hypothetical protein
VNDDYSFFRSYPASYDLPNIITVAATDELGSLAYFSNYGQASVDLAAPGVNILSTYLNGKYAYLSGTSMATPHVTGAVALYAAANPGATAAQIGHALLSSTTPTTSLVGKTVTGGRLNVSAALGLPPDSAPAAPSNLGVDPPASSSQLTIRWTDGSTNEAGFRIQRKTGSGGSYADRATLGAGVTSWTDTGLSPGTTYSYRVLAYNDVGSSNYSNEASGTTLSGSGGVPAAPGGLSVAAPTVRGQLTLTWADNSGNVQGFKIERRKGSGAFKQVATVGPNVTGFTDTGLAARTRYTYRVRAYNASGNSPYSNTAAATTLR